ncbi:thiamine pyrophosphate-dependent enzyme [Lipingzhangella sp. LS1_29]|uniref:2-oxoisovalerate dehydrogenase subunit alpha n=1 Tax=Lipingzhangella rawalii TaxID=2055835 RepID=A0ABU2HB32_9ACTN|nr:thiamine pyrophosphate-dependent enzyme [Lipingzhangella rawalii]MDS1272528.1 thiamine pyrophosphate-dependent enzyme [Lipingzhangella rawalii]
MKRNTATSGVTVPPALEPLRLVDSQGGRVSTPPLPVPELDTLGALHRAMVIGRRFDRQASALARQGRLAVYPSSFGQEACQVGGVLALAEQDWLFPTYRDTVSLVTRGVDPVQALTLLRGDWHSGYDAHAHRCAPQCTPLATNASHAVGLTYAARQKRHQASVPAQASTAPSNSADPAEVEADTAALVLMGDGATSEGDAHEAYNFAAMWNAPVVFLIQNNQWAISVPVRKQSRAPTLAHKAMGYGIRGLHVDGNDAAAVYAAVSQALTEARAGEGPTIIEARTYRMDPHTNADAPQRYREPSDVERWQNHDPIDRLESLLRAEGQLDDAGRADLDATAEKLATRVREHMAQPDELDPNEILAHTYTHPSAMLREQQANLAAEIGEARA